METLLPEKLNFFLGFRVYSHRRRLELLILAKTTPADDAIRILASEDVLGRARAQFQPAPTE
jgi:hypothetical protein